MKPKLQKIKDYKELRHENLAVIFRTTAITMMISELTGVIAVLIDGIVTSQGLGMDAYSGISLLRPFTSVVLLFAGFLSTGCNIVCSRNVGVGKEKEANEVFNLSSLLAVVISGILILLAIFLPTAILTISGVSLTKYPELNPIMYSYLHGYIIGLPAMMLIQVMGPILVMDGCKKLFTVSSVALCAVDIIGDLLNVYVFHGGAFGMGVATSAAYIVQLLIILFHFIKRSSYFRLSIRFCRLSSLKDLIKNGTPALVKKASGALRDISVNYINIMVALSSVAIAAKGIQNDFFQFLFCIPTGLGRALITMVGLYYAANDLQGMKRLLSYAVRFGSILSGAAAVLTFLFAPYLTRIYSSDPEVISLAVFSIRCMSVSLVFDTLIVLVQHYLQGTDNLKQANILAVFERFITPTLSALILGLAFGSKGILASMAASKLLLLILLIISNLIYFKGKQRDWTQMLFLPKGFGLEQSDNLYAKIHSRDEALEVSKQAYHFCMEHDTGERTAQLTSLFVEEMTINVFNHDQGKKKDKVYIDFRLYICDGKVAFSMMDLGDLFSPALFYELHKEDAPGTHIGIRMVTDMAKEMRYVSTLKSNNLTVMT